MASANPNKPKLAIRVEEEDNDSSSFVDLQDLVENQDDEQTEHFGGWLNSVWPSRWGTQVKNAVKLNTAKSASHEPIASRESYDALSKSVDSAEGLVKASESSFDTVKTNAAPEGVEALQGAPEVIRNVSPLDVISLSSSSKPSSVETVHTPRAKAQNGDVVRMGEESSVQPDSSDSESESKETEVTETTVEKPHVPQFTAELQELNDIKIATIVQEIEDRRGAAKLQKKIEDQKNAIDADRKMAEELQKLEERHSKGLQLQYDGSSGDEIEDSDAPSDSMDDFSSENNYDDLINQNFWSDKNFKTCLLVAFAIFAGIGLLGWGLLQVFRTTEGLYWGPLVYVVAAASVLGSGYYLYQTCVGRGPSNDRAYAGLQEVLVRPN